MVNNPMAAGGGGSNVNSGQKWGGGSSSLNSIDDRIGALRAAVNDEQPDFAVFQSVMIYSLLILGSPIITFFITQYLISGVWGGDSDITSNVISAIAAVVALHLFLGVFIYKAYFKDNKKKSD